MPRSVLPLLAVTAGGMVGSALRLGADAVVPSDAFPLSTLAVNIVGSFTLAVIVGRSWAVAPEWLRAGLGPGLLGAFTTFSAIMVSLIQLTVTASVLAALAYAVTTLVLGFAATALGIYLTIRPTAVIVATIIAGGLAAVVRYAVTLWFARNRRAGDAAEFPWAVLVVNVVGSGIAGAVLALAEASSLSVEAQWVLLGGVCGGLTTFSTFSLETIQLVRAGSWRRAAVSVAANLALGLAACTIGFVVFSGTGVG